MKEIAIKRGGECLSTEFLGVGVKLKWKCSNHHIWETAPHYIINRNQWCKKCARESIAAKQRHKTSYIQNFAESRNGKLLSTEYINAHQKLLWQCSFGHQFFMPYSACKRGSWCPECSKSIGERICREWFEKMFDRKFPTIKPKWLHGLELDGYCAELGLAFEHNGEQHYRVSKHFKMTKKTLSDIKKRDTRKKDLCKTQGVTLIVIPQLFVLTKIKDIKLVVREQIIKQSFKLPKNFDIKEINLCGAYKNPDVNKYMERLKKIVNDEFGGEILSQEYINAHYKLEFLCRKHNVSFVCEPNTIVRGSWGCKKCKKEKMESKYLYGSKHPGSVLTEDTVIEMRRLYSVGNSMASISRKFLIPYQTVASAIKKRNWKHI